MAATGTAIFLSGCAGMGMEILWFRHLISALGAHRATFSLLLSVILAGIWIGSTVGGRSKMPITNGISAGSPRDPFTSI